MIMMMLMMRIMMTTLMVLIRDESVDNPNPKIILGHPRQGIPDPKIITRTTNLDWITFLVVMVCPLILIVFMETLIMCAPVHSLSSGV